MADKGLKSNVVGLFGGTILGISSVAPAYALTVTLGVLAASVGAKTFIHESAHAMRPHEHLVS